MVTPPPPPPPPSSLQEQQQRFIAAQHLMAVPRPRPADHSRNAVAVAGVEVSRKRSRHAGKRNVEATAPLLANRPKGNGPRPQGKTPQGKTAYAMQKEYRDELEKEARDLEEQVERLRLEVGLPTKTDKQELTVAQQLNAAIDEKIHTARRYEVRLHSLVKEQLQVPPVNPLSTYIHLPCDQTQRRAILLAMKDVKLRRAAEIGIERFRYLDANESYLCEERFTTDDDVYYCNRWEMNAFPNFRTTREMFDALVFWVYNMEISVTEIANQVAVREDTGEAIAPTIWNQRIVTTTEGVGCIEELNMANFAQFYESYDLLDGAPLGILITDTVDEDDLYPYKPLERTRKDVQAYHLFSEDVDPQTQQKTVVLKTCVINAQLPPEFPVERRVVEKLYENMSGWIIVMKKYLSEYTVPP